MFFKIPRKVISDMVEDYTEILRGKSLIIILKKTYEWIILPIQEF